MSAGYFLLLRAFSLDNSARNEIVRRSVETKQTRHPLYTVSYQAGVKNGRL